MTEGIYREPSLVASLQAGVMRLSLVRFLAGKEFDRYRDVVQDYAYDETDRVTNVPLKDALDVLKRLYAAQVETRIEPSLIEAIKAWRVQASVLTSIAVPRANDTPYEASVRALFAEGLQEGEIEQMQRRAMSSDERRAARELDTTAARATAVEKQLLTGLRACAARQKGLLTDAQWGVLVQIWREHVVLEEAVF